MCWDPSTKLLVGGLCNDSASFDVTSYSFSIDNRFGLNQTLRVGFFDRLQLLPQTGTFVVSRRLAVASLNNSRASQNAHRQVAGVGAP